MRNGIFFNIDMDATAASFQGVVAKNAKVIPLYQDALPEILFITSYPPRECGIATYSQDLFKALDNKFVDSFSLKVCALEAGQSNFSYPEEVKYILDATDADKYDELAHTINQDYNINLVVVQHEFGLFPQAGETAFLNFIQELNKPVVVVFHTVLPQPDESLKSSVINIAEASAGVVVMTQNAAQILQDDYGISKGKVTVIPHGTHLVPHLDKNALKEKYGVSGRKVLSTFGLLSSGKGIETTLASLPAIIEQNPEVLFLVIGKTHPGVVKVEGERYRQSLESKVKDLNLENHVKFINHYLLLEDLLEYLQLTDIYLFTSIDPNQAVSGTFSYALSCGCPIVSTPIPHAKEVLQDGMGVIVDFQHPQQLADGVNRLLGDEALRTSFRIRTLEHMLAASWENSAIAHAQLLQKNALPTYEPTIMTSNNPFVFQKRANRTQAVSLHYRLPEINLDHVKKMTTHFGMLQFSKINQPDLESGYTLDDNARAMIAMCMSYENDRDIAALHYLHIYLDFIQFCLHPEGDFLNYVDAQQQFTEQNNECNLADSNGRAIWALGFLLSKRALLPANLIEQAEEVFQRALSHVEGIYSPRAMAFIIKGLYYSNQGKKSAQHTALITTLANRLLQMYRDEGEQGWSWYEDSLTYANSVLPEAMLCAWLETGTLAYKETALITFDFLLSHTFDENGIQVISNRSWLHKGQEPDICGEQPIDVAYTIFTLSKFYDAFQDDSYLQKMELAFNWFLGNNRLKQIIYNPCTGGCYDGLEDTHVNLNQGAESTLCYLMARLTVVKHQIFKQEKASRTK